MMNQKVVVVTGASAGLGRSISIEAGKRSATVVLIARRERRLTEIQQIIRQSGGNAMVLQADVSDAGAVAEAFSGIDSTCGAIDILFNCAGVVEPVVPAHLLPDDALLNSLLTNVYGVYIATREALKRMKKQESGGTIINIASGAADKPYAGLSAYSSQKAAVNIFTRAVALETAGTPIRITAISPGPFEGNMQEILRSSSEEFFPARDKFTSLFKEGRLSKPEPLAKILLEIAFTDWPELSGRIADVRDPQFRKECEAHGVSAAP